MTGRKSKVIIAMSGGVDSSVAAALLLEAGFDCAGVYMITSQESAESKKNAVQVAEKLGLTLYVQDFCAEFESVFDYFCTEYSKGRTPNPCVFCNRYIKFGKLRDFARQKGADYLATGHYARIIKNKEHNSLYKGLSEDKEQSYFLAMVRKEILSYIILPVGEYSKQDTRRMAEEFGLDCVNKQESQEICFLPKNWVSVLEQRHPELVHSGNIVDSKGKVLGSHKGVHQFTIGQRRGLGVAKGRPFYVTKIDAEENTVTLGPKPEVMHRSFLAKDLNWLADEPADSFRAKVKIRYNSKGSSATVYPEQTEGVRVKFDEPVLAVTAGQLAAFYVRDEIGERVIGSGWIEKVIE
ncbi:tRNA 2-thiouridine(34) synthase MnmA [Planctomycetota bacterium]